MRIVRALTLCLLPFLALPAAAQAPRPADVVQAVLRPGWRQADGTHMAALHLHLAPGWMTYWRHPGESGIVPQVSWSRSDNLDDLRIHWPEPRLIHKAGFDSIGYMNEVVLPVQLRPRQPGQPITLRAVFSIGVCDDICMPVDLEFSGVLPASGQADRVIERALDSRARNARSAGLRKVTCSIDPDPRGIRLSAVLDLPASGGREFVLLEPAGVTTPTRVMGSERVGPQLVGQVQMRSSGNQMPAIDRSRLGIRIVTEHGMWAHQGCSVTP